MSVAATAHDFGLNDDAAQVERAKARDPDVWALWHDHYYRLLYRYAYARLLRPEDAEDVASQVFLEALKSIDSYRYTGKPILAWLYGIAHHMVSRKVRQQGRATGLEAAGDAEAGGFEEASVLKLEIREALARLKPEHREVLVLRFVLELPTRRVAEILGKTEAGTYSLQVRAASALRRAMSQ